MKSKFPLWTLNKKIRTGVIRNLRLVLISILSFHLSHFNNYTNYDYSTINIVEVELIFVPRHTTSLYSYHTLQDLKIWILSSPSPAYRIRTQDNNPGALQPRNHVGVGVMDRKDSISRDPVDCSANMCSQTGCMISLGIGKISSVDSRSISCWNFRT